MFGSLLSGLSSAANSSANFNPSSNLSKVQTGLNNFNQGLQSGFSELSQNLPAELQSYTGRFNQLTGQLTQVQNTFNTNFRALNGADFIGITDLTNGISNATNTISSLATNVENVCKVIPQTFDSIAEDLNNITGAVENIIEDPFNIGTFGEFGPPINIEFPNSNGRREQAGSVNITGNGRIANPLRDYASYNYIITLGSLSAAELNTPESSYRGVSGIQNMIAKSAGGGYNQRVTTFSEDEYGPHAEYYIQDLEIETVTAPNPRTGIGMGTNIRFNVLEPYSMGQFLEALQISAGQSGFSNYIEAVYVLKIDFAGYLDDGQSVPGLAAPSRYIPINLVNIEFEVDGDGSRYEIEAIPYNEIANIDEVNVIRNDVNVTGRTVADVLQNGPNSLTAVLNRRAEQMESSQVFAKSDRYVILIPQDKQGATNAVESGQPSGGGAVQNFNSVGFGSGQIDPSLAAAAGITEDSRINVTDSAVFDILRGYAQSDISSIGQSALITDPVEEGDQPMAQADQVVQPDDRFGGIDRGRVQPRDDLERNFQYTQGNDIIGIISDVIIQSDYARQLVEQPPTNGMKSWFRVETQVFVEPNYDQERTGGRAPRVYVYSVVPYLVDEATWMAPGRRPEGTEYLKSAACKEYNYLYTGKNEDVLDFKIEFKTAFYQNLAADLGQHIAALRANASRDQVDRGPRDLAGIVGPGVGNTSAGDLSEPAPTYNETTQQEYTARGGTRLSPITAAKRAVAQSFHDALINSDTDMISAEMDIWGDPYFLPTSGMGNYNAPPSGLRPNLTSDGSMDYQNNDVLVVVNFRTPYDYGAETMQFSHVVKPFSGLYKVLGVINNFADGQYKQTIKMIRRRGQNDDPTGDTPSQSLNTGQVLSSTNTHGQTGPSVAGAPVNSGQTPVPGANTGTGGNPNAQELIPGVSTPTETTSITPGGLVPSRNASVANGLLATITTSIQGKSTNVAASVRDNFQGLIDELEQTYGYEIRSIGGYNYRTIGNRTTLSWHASGIAIDINPYPDNADGSQLTTNLPYPPDGSEMVALAAKYGLGWGGAWTGGYYDAMHFSAASNEQGTIVLDRGQIPT